jgi:hypothetical protein
MWCRVLELASNQLEGGIPFTFGSLVSLSALTVDNNRVSEMPQSLLSLAALRCGLSGGIVFRFVALLRRSSLIVRLTAPTLLCRTLSLCNNSFSGALPAFLLNATWITCANALHACSHRRSVTCGLESFATGHFDTTYRRAV